MSASDWEGLLQKKYFVFCILICLIKVFGRTQFPLCSQNFSAQESYTGNESSKF